MVEKERPERKEGRKRPGSAQTSPKIRTQEKLGSALPVFCCCLESLSFCTYCPWWLTSLSLPLPQTNRPQGPTGN